ncbi:MAG: TrkA C-terminal domain-containing protein [Desulfobacterales bacterium]|jgi:putative transport protein
MLSTFYSYLLQHPVLVFFLVLSLGYLIGNIRVLGISLGPVGGVLIAGLVFGHYGFTMYSGAQTFGFVLFIFCVGYQAGPNFIDVLLSDGLKYLALALVVAATGFGLSVGFSNLLDLAPGLSAGLMGGAMTTTPTLAAAQEAILSGLAKVPDGYTSEQVLTNIGAGYALTYLFGLVGLILIIRLMPRVLGLDLPTEAAKLAGDDEMDSGPDLSEISRRIYRITREKYLNRTIHDIMMAAPKEISIVAIRRKGNVIPIDYDTRFELDDEVLVIGRVGYLLENVPDFGEEISDEEGLNVPMCTAQVIVSKSDVIGVPIADIRLEEHIGVLVLGIRRQRTKLPISGSIELHRGDVITIYGPEFVVQTIADHVGHVERDFIETDLFTFALGIAVGIGLGTLAVTIGGVTIQLGMAGGLLISGLLVGFLRSIWPIFGRVPSASRWVLMELGLLMFMAGVGINSGGGIVDVIQSAGVKLIGVGILVTSIPVFVGYFFSRKVLKLNSAAALGGVTGSMTSGAALSVVTEAAKSNAPSLGYTGAYAFANVILTLAGTFIMMV